MIVSSGDLAWRTRAVLCLRGLAYIFAWQFVVPSLSKVLQRFFLFFWGPPGHDNVLPTNELLAAELIYILITATVSAALLLSEREHGQFGALGLFARRCNLAGQDRVFARAAFGAALGGVFFTLMMAGLLAAGAYSTTLSAAPYRTIVTEVISCALLFAAVGFFEEFMFRGYLQQTLSDAGGFWPATAITSLWFGWAHAAGSDTLIGSASTILFGVIACMTLRLTGNLWFIIGFHAGWDFTETVLFGTPNGGVNLHQSLARSVTSGPVWLTGGAAGPEGSAACFMLYISLIVGLAFRLHANSRHSQSMSSSDDIIDLQPEG